jgi:hypothetical protein
VGAFWFLWKVLLVISCICASASGCCWTSCWILGSISWEFWT